MQKLTRNGKTIIFSTHDFNIAVSQSDKIWLMLDDGLVEGAPEDLILKGVMARLFDSSVINFNPYDGSFSFRSDETGSIFLEGSSPDRYWFEKALSRAGISISRIKTNPYLNLNNATPSSVCQLIEGNKVTEFKSIYDLIKYLRRQ
jgi:iron complex transport system ATP-binding protein